MSDNDPFRFDPEDIERMLRGGGDQLRSALGDLGRLFETGGVTAGWSSGSRRTRPAPAPETTGEAGEGVWAIYTVDEAGDAHVESVFATELEALRANQHNTESTRKVRFLPYGIAVSLLDASPESHAD